MRSLTRTTSLVLAAAAAAACADQPTTSARDAGPRLAAATACAASPTAVVSSEAELRAALAAAQPGHVIAVSGMIEINEYIILSTPGITITCAQPGAGIELAPGYPDVIFEMQAGHITISGLVLDAPEGYGPIYGASDGVGDLSGIRIVGNTMECGYGTCVFLVSTPGLQVTDNHMEGYSSYTGIQLQALYEYPGGPPIVPMDDVVVTRNVIEVEEGYAVPSVYGAIRLRDGSNATITHNDIHAGWANGIVLTNVYDSQVDQNRIDGTTRHGIDIPVIAARPIILRGVSFTGNQVSNAAGTAVRVDRACDNLFQGNNIQHNNAQGAVFLASTGDNVWRGNAGTVQDLGAFDCDGDGEIDPNQISGARASASTAAATGFSVSAAPAPSGGNGRFAAQQ
jgi:Right handed beta helix region